jgi:hypothetical protein
MDPVGLMLLCNPVAETHEVDFVRDVGEVRGDTQSPRQPLDLAQPTLVSAIAAADTPQIATWQPSSTN